MENQFWNDSIVTRSPNKRLYEDNMMTFSRIFEKDISRFLNNDTKSNHLNQFKFDELDIMKRQQNGESSSGEDTELSSGSKSDYIRKETQGSLTSALTQLGIELLNDNTKEIPPPNQVKRRRYVGSSYSRRKWFQCKRCRAVFNDFKELGTHSINTHDVNIFKHNHP